MNAQLKGMFYAGFFVLGQSLEQSTFRFELNRIEIIGYRPHGYKPSILVADNERSTPSTPTCFVSVEPTQISRQFRLLRGLRKLPQGRNPQFAPLQDKDA